MGKENLLQRIPKGTISYKMGYRWKDMRTGREFTVHPFGYEGRKTKNIKFKFL